MNRTIRARIHETAVKRVTRIYAATLADIFAETLQNSRRADAVRVRISVSAPTARPNEFAATTGETPLTVTVSDDGAGIADPAVLLSFGENGWDDATVRREDAAGFGFASLARRNCTVSSRPRSPNRETPPGWKVQLVPGHFLGEAEAEVHAHDEAPYPYGTVISFEATEVRRRDPQRGRECRPALPPAGRCSSNGADGEAAVGEELPRRAFLDGAVHAERMAGARVRGLQATAIAATGTPISISSASPWRPSLPTVETVHGASLDRPGRHGRLSRTSNWSCRPARRRSRTPFSRRCAQAVAADHLPRHDRRSRPVPGLRGLDAGPQCRHRDRPSAGRAPSLAALASPTATTGASRASWPTPSLTHRQAPLSWAATRSRPRLRRSGAPPNASASHRACSRPTAGWRATPGTTRSTA